MSAREQDCGQCTQCSLCLSPSTSESLDHGSQAHRDFADDHPGANVIGTDISPIQPKWVPPNLKL